jgi:hypothetical protein
MNKLIRLILLKQTLSEVTNIVGFLSKLKRRLRFIKRTTWSTYRARRCLPHPMQSMHAELATV